MWPWRNFSGRAPVVGKGLKSTFELAQRVARSNASVLVHGETGVGAEAYIADKHPLLPIYNLSGPQVAGYTDGYIYGMIRVGRGLMPAYAHQISHFDRWHIVNYVRTLQRAAGNTPIIDQAGGN